MPVSKQKKAGIAALLILLMMLIFSDPLMDFAVDATFPLFPHTETELRVRDYAAAHGVSFRDYPKSLIALLERNPETEEFVLGYPFRSAQTVSLQEYEHSPSVPLFLQWDDRWGYEKYGSDVIGITGCGPTCLAMVGYYLTGDSSFTPDAVAAFAQKNGYYAKGYGSSWTLISEGGEKLGLTVTELPLDEGVMKAALKAGKPIILALRKGDFTDAGHYIVLRGVENGEFLVNDPNSRVNSERTWSYEQLKGQIRNIWSIEQ